MLPLEIRNIQKKKNGNVALRNQKYSRKKNELQMQLLFEVKCGKHFGLILLCIFLLLSSTDDFRWVREVFITGTMGSGRLGRKLDLEREERFTFHLLDRDSNPSNTMAHNVVDAIDHSKRVIIILST